MDFLMNFSVKLLIMPLIIGSLYKVHAGLLILTPAIGLQLIQPGACRDSRTSQYKETG